MSEAEVREIPEKAQKVLLEAYSGMQTAWEAFQEKKKTFVEMVVYTRKALGIPTEELWDLADDVSKFTKVDSVPSLQLVEDEPEEEIVLTPEQKADGQ